MRISILILFVLLAVPLKAQDHCERTIDSLRTELSIAQAEVRRADHQAELFAQTIAEVFRGETSTPGGTSKHIALTTLTPYITIGSEGQSHSDASIYGGIGLEYRTGSFGVDCAARYQNSPANTSADTARQKWRTVFFGGLKLFLY